MKRFGLRRGFTLIELLVVIGVLAILAALLFPVFQSSRNQAKSAVCVSNLHQIGVAISVYGSDYDDHLPYAADALDQYACERDPEIYGELYVNFYSNAKTFTTVMTTYVREREVFHCPLDLYTAEDIERTASKYRSWFEEFKSSYEYNDGLVAHNLLESAKLPPAATVIVRDYDWFHGGSKGAGGWVNCLYEDMHIKRTSWWESSDLLDEDR